MDGDGTAPATDDATAAPFVNSRAGDCNARVTAWILALTLGSSSSLRSPLTTATTPSGTRSRISRLSPPFLSPRLLAPSASFFSASAPATAPPPPPLSKDPSSLAPAVPRLTVVHPHARKRSMSEARSSATPCATSAAKSAAKNVNLHCKPLPSLENTARCASSSAIDAVCSTYATHTPRTSACTLPSRRNCPTTAARPGTANATMPRSRVQYRTPRPLRSAGRCEPTPSPSSPRRNVRWYFIGGGCAS